MVDIAMCSRSDCGKRMTCFRYIADADEFGQSYIMINQVDVDNGCDRYWQCRNKKELRIMNRLNK